MTGRIIVLALGVFLLTGCVSGQHIRMDFAAGEAAGGKARSSVLLGVTDARAYVLSGEKESSYIGRYRAGFGNPWSVTTFQRVPLAEHILRDLKKEMKSLGFTGTEKAPAMKRLAVEIVEWNFDGFQNGRFWYEIAVRVEDAAGNILTAKTLKEEIVVKGTVMLGARGGFEREMPLIYGQVIRALVRTNPEVLEALTR